MGIQKGPCKCGKPAETRGACRSCYVSYMHQIEKGEVNEQTLVKQGKLTRKRRKSEGIALHRDDKVFRYRSRQGRKLIRGLRSRDNECLVPDCPKDAYRRGLCNTHRVYANRVVKRGDGSEEDLLKRGLLLPKPGKGSEPASKRARRKNPLLKPKKRSTRSRKSGGGQSCLLKTCKSRPHAKGLCKPHYNQAMRELKKCASREERRKLKRKWASQNMWLAQTPKRRKNPFSRD